MCSVVCVVVEEGLEEVCLCVCVSGDVTYQMFVRWQVAEQVAGSRFQAAEQVAGSRWQVAGGR